jgi:hypothetical protein
LSNVFVNAAKGNKKDAGSTPRLPGSLVFALALTQAGQTSPANAALVTLVKKKLKPKNRFLIAGA